jgi:hypothetical protein
LTGGVTGEWRRQTCGGAAAGTRTPARTGEELVNVWHGQLHWDLEDVLRWLVGSVIARGEELVDGCSTAAAGTLAPVSRRLGQANKRAHELQGVLVERGVARVCEEKQAGMKFTVWHPWRMAADRVLARGEDRPALQPSSRRLSAFLHTKARGEAVQARHGRGTAGWAAMRGGQSPTRGGAARVRRQRRWVAGTAGVSTWRTGRRSGWRFDASGPTAHGPAGGRLPRRPGPRGGRGERARRGATRRDVVRCGALAQNSSKYPTSN